MGTPFGDDENDFVTRDYEIGEIDEENDSQEWRDASEVYADFDPYDIEYDREADY